MRQISTAKLGYFIALTLVLIAALFSPALGKNASAKAAQIEQTDIPQHQKGVFTPAPCWTTIPPHMTDHVTCGYVSVPERHANPDGPQIRLAVLIIRATAPDPQPDPLFFLQGGPGGSTIDTYADLLLTIRPLLTDRDIILFDQRGTLYSQPSLICKEYDQLLLDTIEKDIPDEEYLRMEEEAYTACRERLLNQGIDLAAYNSLENSADIHAIRQALGYEQINLYGVSYGSLLALHTMRFYPEHLRSVILDGVVPPQTNFLIQVPQTAQRAFSYLFESCSQDKECSTAFPDLENRFYQLVDSFNQNPTRIPLTDPDSGITYQAILDGDTFLDGIFQFLYIGDFIPAIPIMIADAENGKFDLFARIMSILVFDRTYSYGMYFSVLCSEDADFSPDQVLLNGIHPQLAETQADDASQFLKTCDIWNVNALNGMMDEPVNSQLPVLILSGGFDPITPPANGLEAAKTLPNSFVVEFPTGAHGAALDGDCQDEIIRAFLDQPDQPPDTSCVEPVDSMEFYTPETVILIPAAIQLLNLENMRGVQFLILLAASLFLLPTILITPARQIWKIYKLFPVEVGNPITLSAPSTPDADNPSHKPWKKSLDEKPKPSWLSWLAHSSQWLFWFFSFVNWLFLISFFSILALMLAQNDTRLYFGLPGQSRFLFILPLIMLLTFLMQGIALIKNWTSTGQRWISKLGMTLGWLLCLVILIILNQWEILFAFF